MTAGVTRPGLPTGWTEAPLGEVCSFVNGGTPSKSVTAYFNGKTPWITGADIVGPLVTQARSHITSEAEQQSSTNRVPAGTLLLVTRTSVGKVAVAAMDLCFSQDITAVLPDRSRLDTGYLAHFLRSRQSNFARAARGATIKGISRDVVAGTACPLPPLPEQRRIAAILDHAESLRAKRRQALDLLDTLTQSIFTDMFGNSSWTQERLDGLVDSDDQMNYGVVQPGDDEPGGVPLIRVSNLIDGAVARGDLKRIAPEIDAAYSRSRIRGNEILVSSVGSIGVVSVVRQEDIGSNIARAVTRVPISDEFLRTYVAAYLRTPKAQRYFDAELRTVAQPTLNVGQLAATEIPVPPADLQRRFSNRLKVVEGTRADCEEANRRLHDLAASLQHRAFRGEL